MKSLTCQEHGERNLIPPPSVTELYCSYLINIGYSICQSEALFHCNDKCVFNIINAFIVSGQMTMTLPQQRQVKHHSE